MAQLFKEIKENKGSEIEKFNPYHDKMGRFSSANGAASFTYKPGKGKMYDNAIEREKERTSKMDGEKPKPQPVNNEKPKKPVDPHSFNKDDVRNEVERLKNASQEEKNKFLLNHYTSEEDVKEFEEHGETDNLLNFVAECAERSAIPDNVEKRQEQDSLIRDTDERVERIMQESGVSESEARKFDEVLQAWFNDSSEVSSEGQDIIQEYLDKSPVYEGTIYRGIHLSEGDFDDFMSQAEAGSNIKMNGMSSWSSDESIAESFAHSDSSWYDSVILECVSNKTGSPVAHLSVPYHVEQEVIAGKDTKWMVLKSEVSKKGNGRRIARIYVTEWGEKAA